jgi:predicted lipopolysaccharide heptosyltransferase III
MVAENQPLRAKKTEKNKYPLSLLRIHKFTILRSTEGDLGQTKERCTKKKSTKANEPLVLAMVAGGKKLLLIKLAYIGDTVSLLPVVENLREKAPHHTVDVMVNGGSEELLAYHPGIRKVWSYDRRRAKRSAFSSVAYHARIIRRLRAERYDTVIDYTYGDRSSFLSFMTGARQRITYQSTNTLSRLLMTHFIPLDPLKHHIVDCQLESLKSLGIQEFDRKMTAHIPPDLLSEMDHRLYDSGIGPDRLKVVIHPGARKRLREWRPERFGEIGRRLRDLYCAAIILIGGPGDEASVENAEKAMGSKAEFKSTGLSLLELAAVLRRSHLYIGNDSGPGHIASAVHCPTLTLFGSTYPQIWRPMNSEGEVVFKNVPCCGCRQETCIRPEANCMDLIDVEEVWEKAVKLLRRHEAKPRR